MDYKIIKEFQEYEPFSRVVNNCQEFGIDLEFEPYFLLQVKLPNTNAKVLVFMINDETIELIRNEIFVNNKIFYFFDVSQDLKALDKYGLINNISKKNIIDIQSMLYDIGLKNISLDKASYLFLNIGKIGSYSKARKLSFEEFARYGAVDADLTYKLSKIILNKSSEEILEIVNEKESYSKSNFKIYDETISNLCKSSFFVPVQKIVNQVLNHGGSYLYLRETQDEVKNNIFKLYPEKIFKKSVNDKYYLYIPSSDKNFRDNFESDILQLLEKGPLSEDFVPNFFWNEKIHSKVPLIYVYYKFSENKYYLSIY